MLPKFEELVQRRIASSSIVFARSLWWSWPEWPKRKRASDPYWKLPCVDSILRSELYARDDFTFDAPSPHHSATETLSISGRDRGKDRTGISCQFPFATSVNRSAALFRAEIRRNVRMGHFSEFESRHCCHDCRHDGNALLNNKRTPPLVSFLKRAAPFALCKSAWTVFPNIQCSFAGGVSPPPGDFTRSEFQRFYENRSQDVRKRLLSQSPLGRLSPFSMTSFNDLSLTGDKFSVRLDVGHYGPDDIEVSDILRRS